MRGDRPESVYILATELIFYAQKAATARADEVLSRIGFGRAHYRVLHFVNYNNGITTNGLLKHLKITASSLSRVMNQLIKGGYVSQENNLDDRRQRHHHLTEKGKKLQAKIYTLQREVLKNAFDIAGDKALDSFIKVLAFMIPEEDRALLSVTVPV